MSDFGSIGKWITGILCSIWSAGLASHSLMAAQAPEVSNTGNTAILEARLSVKQHATAQLEMLGFPANGEAFVRTIASSHRPLIELYMDSGVDPNSTDPEGRSALLVSALSRNWDLVSKLLDAGADPKKADIHGVTPLMAAAGAGHLQTVKALQAHGADAAAADENGRTACHYAIAADQTPILKQLLDSGVPLPGPTRDGRDCARLAFETADRNIVELTLTHQTGRVDWNSSARAAFLQVLEARDVPFGQLMVSKFNGPPAADDDSQPLVAYAIARDNHRQLEALLDFGANPNVTLDKPGDTVFHDLMPANFVRYYVEKEPGVTALDIASGLKRIDCIKLLLSRGANKDQPTAGKSKLYAMYFAAWAESPDALQILLGNAPDRNLTRIDVSLGDQRATFIKDGVKVLSTEISTGKEGHDTKPGDFVITDKHLEHHSTLYHNASMPFFMRLSFQSFGLHQGYVTGQPASHGCIRLPAEVAKRLFKEAPIGTWVSINP